MMLMPPGVPMPRLLCFLRQQPALQQRPQLLQLIQSFSQLRFTPLRRNSNKGERKEESAQEERRAAAAPAAQTNLPACAVQGRARMQ